MNLRDEVNCIIHFWICTLSLNKTSCFLIHILFYLHNLSSIKSMLPMSIRSGFHQFYSSQYACHQTIWFRLNITKTILNEILRRTKRANKKISKKNIFIVILCKAPQIALLSISCSQGSEVTATLIRCLAEYDGNITPQNLTNSNIWPVAM